MAFEKFGKMLGNMASTTAKKATEQAQIAKLGIDRAGIERQIDGVYAAMGRFCYNLIKSGTQMPEELNEYCRDIETLNAQLAELENNIAAHKSARDAAEYTVSEDFLAIFLTLHQFNKMIEQIRTVLRSRCAFRMILYTEHFILCALHAFYCSIQNIFMRYYKTGPFNALTVYCIRMIL